jgi:hypothetical protein
MKSVFSAFVLLVSLSSFASREEFCSQKDNGEHFQQLLKDESNRLGFTNVAGKFQTGLCWWHSQFQRKAVYLTDFEPNSPKPTREEAIALIKDIRHGNGVVVIPGFANLNEFSSYYSREIISVLEGWLVGSSVGFGWLKGVLGSPEVSAEKFKAMMDDTYELVVEKKTIVFQVLQLQGLDAHAWLVTDMKKVDDGYDLLVIDSNYHSSQVYNYRVGMTHFSYSYLGKFVPYTYSQGDVKSFARARKSYCKYGTTASDERQNLTSNQ